MKTQAITVETVKTLKRADALAVGDKIQGVSKYSSIPVTWTVADVQTKTDPVLGTVVQVNAHVRTDEGYLDQSHEFFMRPSERLWIETAR